MENKNIENNFSDIVFGIDNGTDVAMPLGKMRNYLREWFVGLREEITNIDFEDYNKALTMYDVTSGEPVYHAIFQWGIPVSDKATVYLSGIQNNELRGIIQKEIELDAQIDMYRKQQNNKNNQSNQPSQQ